MPDLDLVMYTLGGLVNPAKGWGVNGDTFDMLDALKRYGEGGWFGLGDRDMATHLLRTQALLRGNSLTAVTKKLTSALGIGQTILPMTDANVETKLNTVEHGELDFRCTSCENAGLDGALNSLRRHRRGGGQHRGAAGAGERGSDCVRSVEPMAVDCAKNMAVPGMRERLLARAVPRVALSPIVGGEAIKGPAAKPMAELGYSVTAVAVAEYYGDIINGFVYDERDADLDFGGTHDRLRAGFRTVQFDTIMKSRRPGSAGA